MRLLAIIFLLIPLSAFAKRNHVEHEDFKTFLSRFIEDRKFSLQRTYYPLTLIRQETDYDDGSEVISEFKSTINKDEDTSPDTIRTYAQENGLKISIENQDKSSATVRVEMPDTCWLLTYHFEKRNTFWYLRSIKDHSL